jgi:hypothetical protein
LIINDIKRGEFSLKPNKKMKNETVDLGSQMDYRSQQSYDFLQSVAAIYMGQTQIMFPKDITMTPVINPRKRPPHAQYSGTPEPGTMTL